MGLTHFDTAPAFEHGLAFSMSSPAAGRELTAQHCHSAEEEIFVGLDGDGFLVLGEDETPVGPGHVIVRPPAPGSGTSCVPDRPV